MGIYFWVLLGLFWVIAIPYQLWTGQAYGRYHSFSRTSQPVGYWIMIIAQIVMLLLCIAMAKIVSV